MLDLDPLGVQRRSAAVAVAEVEDLFERILVPGRRDPEVDEARSGNLRSLDVVQRPRELRELARDLARRARAMRGEPQGGVRRVIAVRRVVRPLELHLLARRLAELRGKPRNRVCVHRYIVGAWRTTGRAAS